MRRSPRKNLIEKFVGCSAWGTRFVLWILRVRQKSSKASHINPRCLKPFDTVPWRGRIPQNSSISGIWAVRLPNAFSDESSSNQNRHIHEIVFPADSDAHSDGSGSRDDFHSFWISFEWLITSRVLGVLDSAVRSWFLSKILAQQNRYQIIFKLQTSNPAS